MSGFLADLEALGFAAAALERDALALVPLALPDGPLLALLPAALAAPALLPEPDLEPLPALLAEAVVRVPDEELLDDALLAVLALAVLALAVLALLVLALLDADLVPPAERVLVALVPELPLVRDPGLALLPAVLAGVLAGVLAVLRDDVDREDVPPEADVPPAERTVRAPEVRVVRLAGVVAAVAVDIALAASVSDLTADSMALVAVLIDCKAVVMVRADVVALLAAVFSFVAAFVTLVAAADTCRGVEADVAVLRLVAVRLVLGRLLVELLAVRLLVVRPADDFVPVAVPDLAELGLAPLPLAVVDLVVARFAVAGGTDPSPRSRSDTGSLIPHAGSFTHRCR
ncbi:MAG TPA: hypothetical protein VMU95_35600 [Trebonia sp.]|nr:hypothetical protein [Trebonia sp.]